MAEAVTTITQERTRLAAVGMRLRRREEAGARFDYTTPNPVTEPAEHAFVHITVTNPGNYASDDAHWRGVEAIGISRFPNTGMPYNRLHMRSGREYEGQPIGRRGAHTVNTYRRSLCTTSGCPSRGRSLRGPDWNLNYNARAYAICQNTDDSVTDAQMLSLAMTIAADVLAGFLRRDFTLHGHRCCTAKSCPGNLMWARMAELKRLVDHYIAVGLEDDMPTEAQFYAWLDEYFLARLKASDYDPITGRPNSMHPVKKVFTVAPWHQALGDQAGQDAQHPLVNMHTVMGDIYWTLKSGVLDKILAAAQVDDVDEEALANLLAPMLNSRVTAVSDADLARISTAVNDEIARRQAS